MKQLLVFLFVLVFAGFVSAQITTVPAVPTNPNDSLTIFVDVALTDCPLLRDNPGPLYFWSWAPNQPVAGNGIWTASNAAMEMTNEGNNIWSITFVPSQFYNDTSLIYFTGISFLVKTYNPGEFGGDCALEQKTEAFTIQFDIPTVDFRQFSTFPVFIANDDRLRISENDVFTLVYDNNAEPKSTMRNATDLFLYTKAYVDNGTGTITETEITPIIEVTTNNALKMQETDPGIFTFSMWPKRFYNVPNGSQIVRLDFKVLKRSATNSDGATDGIYSIRVGCF